MAIPTSPLRRAGAAAVALLLVGALGACGGGGSSSAKPEVPPPGARPAESAAAAVTAVLTAEQRNDHAASFALLSAEGRRQYKDDADWARRRSELPAVTGFRLNGETSGRVTTTVDHQPGLDPFVGLRPARERQVWTGRRAAKGWLVDPDPATTSLLPPDSAAAPAAAAWATAVQACDKAKADGLQGVSTLYGSATNAGGLCHSTGPVKVGAVGRLQGGNAASDIVAQYTADATEWARVVPVTAPVTLKVVLAPIGDEWKVIGLSD